MDSYLHPGHYDLVTPDGKIVRIEPLEGPRRRAEILIESISPVFVGYQLDKELLFFNLKSTLAQLGIDSLTESIELDPKRGSAHVSILLFGIGPIGTQMIELLTVGCYIGKLFAADPRRRVRDPDYLTRMFGRSDHRGRPLLSLGGMHGSEDLIFEVLEGRTVAYVRLLDGRIEYAESVWGFLATVAMTLQGDLQIRSLLKLHQNLLPGVRSVTDGELLLVKTPPLHVRTVFGAVVNELLPPGFRHTSASVLQPDTTHSGDLYEFHGSSWQEINDVPLEFYTLEPHREYIFFSDRDQLQAALENRNALDHAFDQAPSAPDAVACFIVKGEQLAHLREEDWISRSPVMHEFPGLSQGARQGLMVERYIRKQPAAPFLQAIEEGLITSQGILLSRYFPSPVMKRMLLSDRVHRLLKGIYFQYPSYRGGDYFSHEDRSLLLDLAKFAIPVYWLSSFSEEALMYVPRQDKDSGMFVPISRVAAFQRATFFGTYGSNMLSGCHEGDLRAILEGVLELKEEATHPLLNPDTPLALVTGGGPGVMEIGNRVAKELGILSCANIVDFREKMGTYVPQQEENPYIEARMTYRLSRLVERQAEFHLDLPIFLQGGIGTDFEYALEELRKHTGTFPEHPVLLLGERSYWKSKITSRFQCNRKSGTIKGSSWISNAFFCVENAQEGLAVYRAFAQQKLEIGRLGPIYEEGFVTVAEDPRFST